MSNDDFRRDLNRVFDDVAGTPSSNLRERVRASIHDAPERRAPYWIAGVAACVIAALIVSVLFIANPLKRPSSAGAVHVSPSATASAVAQPSVSPSPAASPSAQPFVCSTQDFVSKSSAGAQPPVVYISGLRTGTHGSYDRLTIDLANGVPQDVRISAVAGTGYTLSPSGMPTTVKGKNSVLIVLHGADLHSQYSGSSDILTGYAGMVEVKRIEDFEGVVQIALGVNGSACYRAFYLTGPNRLVIDVQAA